MPFHGKKYEATKNIERRRDEAGKFDSPRAHNELVDTINASAKKQGEEEGIGEATVRRNARFAKGVDRKVAPERGRSSPSLIPLYAACGTGRIFKEFIIFLIIVFFIFSIPHILFTAWTPW